MKPLERVTEQRLRSYLEDIGFVNYKYQSGFRQNKSTDDHLLRLSQSVMECFNRGEHVVAAFLDVEKAFDNVWHNGLRYKIFMLDLPTKITRWVSDFLVGQVIQVNVNNFLSDKISLISGVQQGYVLSPLLFLIFLISVQLSVSIQNRYREFSMRSKVRTYSTEFLKSHKKAMTDWYDSANVKSSKMLSFDSVAEAHDLIYPRPSSKNFSFARMNHFPAVLLTLNFALENCYTSIFFV